jgi:hypothetical protein
MAHADIINQSRWVLVSAIDHCNDELLAEEVAAVNSWQNLIGQ